MVMKLIVVSQYSKNETLLQFFLQILTNYMFSWMILLPAKVLQTSVFPSSSPFWGGRVPLETHILWWSQWWERIWVLTCLLLNSWSWLCFFLGWTRWVAGRVRLLPVFWPYWGRPFVGLRFVTCLYCSVVWQIQPNTCYDALCSVVLQVIIN